MKPIHDVRPEEAITMTYVVDQSAKHSGWIWYRILINNSSCQPVINLKRCVKVLSVSFFRRLAHVQTIDKDITIHIYGLERPYHGVPHRGLLVYFFLLFEHYSQSNEVKKIVGRYGAPSSNRIQSDPIRFRSDPCNPTRITSALILKNVH